MGPKPFLTRVENYLRECRKPNALTYAERARKLRMLARLYHDEIRKDNPSLAADPKEFSEQEIHAIVDWARSKQYGIAYQVKLMQYVRLLTRFLGNPILDRMKQNGEDLPRSVRKRLHAPSTEDILQVRQSLETVGGWRGHALRFAVAFHYATGLRVKELRLARLRDLNLRRMEFTVSAPKGLGVYADGGDGGRRIRVSESLRPVIQDFLDARTRRVECMGLDPLKVEPLIPAWMGKFYGEAGWRGVRSKAFQEAGIKGNFRDLRPAHAMRLKKLGVPIEAVSQRLGHTNTRTTEASYARIADEDAEDACLEAWDDNAVIWK